PQYYTLSLHDALPILIKNTFYPEAPGTLISHDGGEDNQLAKGISSIAGLTLLTLRGLSMVGVPGNAERLFRALASRGVNVILISDRKSTRLNSSHLVI